MNEANDNSEQKKNLKKNSRVWWNSRRLQYNGSLLISGIIAFIIYVIIGTKYIHPYEKSFEITFFTSLLQIVGYLFLMLIANIFYDLGYFFDIRFNKDGDEYFRKQLFRLGFWVSMALPFIVPLNLLLKYLTLYA